MKYILSLLLFFLLLGPVVAQSEQDQVIFKAMQDELQRNKENLALPGMDKPFYLSYSLGRYRQFEVSGVLGAITSSMELPWMGIGSSQLLLGNYDNTSDSRYIGQFLKIGMPAEADYDMIRQNYWLVTDAAYKWALQESAAKEAALKANPQTPEEAALPDLVKAEPITKIVESKPYDINMKEWENAIRELSAIFKGYKDIYNSSVGISGLDMEVYKQTSEGVTMKQPVSYVNFYAQGFVNTADGVKIGDVYSVLVARPQDMPSLEELKKNVKAFAENLIKLKDAPEVEEFYSGPVLFEDGASSAIFTNNLLNQGGLFAYRKPEGGRGGAAKTLDGRIGRKIMDNRLTVKNYSTLDKYNGVPLLGAYEIDAEGVVPAKEMTLVDKGILRQMLNGRVPSLKTPHSTGSSRFVMTGQDIVYVTAPGTIHIEVDKGTKQDKMKKALIKAAKDEGLDYAYIVRSMAGTASRIYKVDVKDGSETQVRFGDVSAINLSKIKRVLDISSKENVSNYILNRQVLSSLIYPASILIEDVEINKSEPKKEKEPVLKFPLQR
ncbi:MULTISPECIES: metallopeptidase TldD-related protein [Butyricimonas]|uniref:metallopeptidase TldD-related protein n=1 Tax=Butyricimonas TaxID=574697 RepID=UPI001D07A948|nr:MULTISPECIES: metallopeptidase TldD-related protein [Butyricimonas]MCB6974808.1 hypothetical protein [Butyricimonas synergistica]MCG4521550.1 metallopeptidase TldD-related protein [Butyricimonas sp. DFI.6.44]